MLEQKPYWKTAFWGEHLKLNEWHSILYEVGIYLPDVERDLADFEVILADLGDIRPEGDCVRLWSGVPPSSEERLSCPFVPGQNMVPTQQRVCFKGEEVFPRRNAVGRNVEFIYCVILS